jgi:hypothetical protein
MRSWRSIFLAAIVVACSCGQEDPPLEPVMGRLAVLSAPPGASVEIDGRPWAVVTPDTIEVVVGTHDVSVSLAGHGSSPASVEVDVTTGDLATAEFCLSRSEASGRIVLLEHFSNIDCEPCGPAEIVLHEFQEDVGYSQVITMGYRTDFPRSRDPLYLQNPAVFSSRMAYYYIMKAPTVILDGNERINTVTRQGLEQMLQRAQAVPVHFAIDVADTLDGTDYRVGARVIPLDCVTETDLVVQFALVEREALVEGTEVAYNAVRDLLPDGSGVSFSPAFGETLSFWRSRSLDIGWHADEIETVVFIQSTDTQEVLQSASTFDSTPAKW